MTEALDKLIAAVEAGDLTVDGAPALSMEMSGIVYAALGDDLWATCVDAFDGSLDSAVALKDELLPGWAWGCGTGEKMPGGAGVGKPTCDGHVGDDSVNVEACTPARALLLATLRAVKGGADAA